MVIDMATPRGVTPEAFKETSDAPGANLHDGLVRSQGGGAVTVRELMRVPDACDTIERWEEFTGRDLENYTRAGLRLERDRLRWVLLTVDDRSSARNEGRLDWLTERLAQVETRLLQ
jgi:hypothetical protein